MAEVSYERQAALRSAAALLCSVQDGELDDVPEVDDYWWDEDGTLAIVVNSVLYRKAVV